jgi:hypothetical protein
MDDPGRVCNQENGGRTLNKSRNDGTLLIPLIGVPKSAYNSVVVVIQSHPYTCVENNFEGSPKCVGCFID